MAVMDWYLAGIEWYRALSTNARASMWIVFAAVLLVVLMILTRDSWGGLL